MSDVSALLVALTAAPSLLEPPIVPLLDLREPSSVAGWRSIHDGVMGGVSSGRVTAADGAARFEGRVSLENGGGFASFRLGVRFPDLSDHDGLRLRVRGDGQVYKLALRTDEAWDGVSWQVPFATVAGAWTSVDLPFDELVPTWRGRLVAGAEPLDRASLRQIGILIADEQEGPFALDLASIDSWRDPSDEAAPGTRAAARVRTGERTGELAGLIDGGADARALADALRWRERPLVVAAPGGLDARSSRQIGRLLARAGELAARELRLVHLLGDRAGRLAGRTLDVNQVKGLRELWDVPASSWAILLVGKDGAVHARSDAPVEADEVLALVDAMPMRQREVEERRERSTGE